MKKQRRREREGEIKPIKKDWKMLKYFELRINYR